MIVKLHSWPDRKPRYFIIRNIVSWVRTIDSSNRECTYLRAVDTQHYISETPEEIAAAIWTAM